MLFTPINNEEIYVNDILWSENLEYVVVVLLDNMWLSDANFTPIWDIKARTNIKNIDDIKVYSALFDISNDELTIFYTAKLEDWMPYQSFIGIYKISDGSLVKNIPQVSAFALVVSKDENKVAMALNKDVQRVIVIFDKKGNMINQIAIPNQMLHELGIGLNSKQLVTRSFEIDNILHVTKYANELDIWDIEAGNKSYVFSEHAEGVTALDICATTNRVCSASSDKYALVWDLDTGNVLYSLEGFSTPTPRRPDGFPFIPITSYPQDDWLIYLKWLSHTNCVAGYEANTMFVWDGTDGTLIHKLLIATASPTYITWSPNEKWLATKIDSNTTIGIWNLSEISQPIKLDYQLDNEDNLFFLNWRADNNQLIGRGEEGSVIIWDTSNDNPEKWEVVLIHAPPL